MPSGWTSCVRGIKRSRCTTAWRQTVPESIIVAILVQKAPASIRNHLQIQAEAIGADYLKAKRAIEGHLQAVRVWTTPST